jgi:hypothetical protein
MCRIELNRRKEGKEENREENWRGRRKRIGKEENRKEEGRGGYIELNSIEMSTLQIQNKAYHGASCNR